MILGRVPTAPPPTSWTPAKRDALLNVAIFAPMAFMFAMGKRPPTWMIAASLGYTAVTFLRDLTKITQADEEIADELRGADVVPFNQILTYRVNRP